MTIHSGAETYHYAEPVASRAMRKIPKKSQGHFVGETTFYRGSICQRLQYESLLEYQVSICAIYRPGFVDIEEQVGGVVYRRANGKRGDYTFDFRLTHEGGQRIGIEVKPWRRAVQDWFRTKMRAIEAVAMPTMVDRVCIVTERHLDPVQLFNAELMHGSRHPEPEIDARVEDAASSVKEPTTISDFLAHTGIGAAGFRSVVRHLHRGTLTSVAAERIAPRSFLMAGSLG